VICIVIRSVDQNQNNESALLRTFSVHFHTSLSLVLETSLRMTVPRTARQMHETGLLCAARVRPRIEEPYYKAEFAGSPSVWNPVRLPPSHNDPLCARGPEGRVLPDPPAAAALITSPDSVAGGLGNQGVCLPAR
jgi:hypothetical protein